MKAVAFGLTAIFFWSTVATAFKIVLAKTDAQNLLLFSSLASLAAISFFLWMRGTSPLHTLFLRKNLFRSLLAGLLNPFIYYLMLLHAYHLLPAQEALVLNYMWPILLGILSAVVFKETLHWIGVIAILISFSGVILVVTKGRLVFSDFTSIKGALLSLSSSLFWALFWIFNKADRRPATVKLFWSFFFGTIYILLFLLLGNRLHLPGADALAGCVYIGLFEMGVTFILWQKAMELSRSSLFISNLAFLSPFLSLMFISLILKERILSSSLIGLLLIVGGILLQSFVRIRGRVL